MDQIRLEHREAARLAKALAGLDQLCSFTGPAKAFWQLYLSELADVTGARISVLLREGPKDAPGWKKVIVWPGEAVADPVGAQFLRVIGDLAESCVQKGDAFRSASTADGIPRTDYFLAVRVAADQQPDAWVAAFLVAGGTHAEAEQALTRVRLLAHIPIIYQLHQQVNRSETAVSHFASVLELMNQVNAQKRFLAAVMTFCNELAARHQCDRVSFGWLEDEYVRLQAMSHSERFDKKMQAITALEAAMEEALDQDEIIVWPEPSDQRAVTRDHRQLAQEHDVKSVCSLPLRLDGKPIAVLACERDSQPFAEVELKLLALCGDMAIRRLSDLKRTDRWFGARWSMAARERLAALIGPEHSGAKLVALAGTIALGVLIFGTWHYRVEAPFSVRAHDVAFLSAPFTGYIYEVNVEVGDNVAKGEPLAALDTRDLLLEQAGAVADRTRYLREAEKALAGSRLAEMRIAQAQAEQSQVDLDLVQYRQRQATIVAPFSGVVIEGDLRKRIGLPVNQGDVLFKVARIDNIYVECHVNERDVQELRENGRGEIAFASLPKHSFPVQIRRIEPVAKTMENANIFVARCDFADSPPAWARPGMSGVAKLDVGERRLLWVVSHRTIDFLRMHWWW
jgi:RND family efflux transporter MFP subunit